MFLALDLDTTQTTIAKNQATSYGLTLVLGLPFSPAVTATISCVQRELEAAAPGLFAWRNLDTLHCTVVSLLRSRFRTSPPLQPNELPSDLVGFVVGLGDIFATMQPFRLELRGVGVSANGTVIVRATNDDVQIRQGLATFLATLAAIEPPKYLSNAFHISIGNVLADRLPQSDHALDALDVALQHFQTTLVGTPFIERVRLVHYANRTLDRIVGMADFALGKQQTVEPECALRELGVPVA